MAFGVFDYYTKKPLNDATKVEWKIKLDEFKDQQRINSRVLKTHVCNDEDMSHFFEFKPADKTFIAKLRENESLWCINADERLEIRGKNEIDSIVLNIDFMVCNPEESNCSHKSIKDVQDYLTNPEFTLVYNS